MQRKSTQICIITEPCTLNKVYIIFHWRPDISKGLSPHSDGNLISHNIEHNIEHQFDGLHSKCIMQVLCQTYRQLTLRENILISVRQMD